MNKRYTKESLEKVILNSKSWAEACRFLHITPATGAQTHLKKRTLDFGIDFSHFTGQGWSKGKKFPPKRIITEYLVNEGPFITSHQLKLRLWKEQLKPQYCEKCLNAVWQGEELPLEIDHINGNHFDNRIDNLVILCPNCHAIKTRKDRKKAV